VFFVQGQVVSVELCFEMKYSSCGVRENIEMTYHDQLHPRMTTYFVASVGGECQASALLALRKTGFEDLHIKCVQNSSGALPWRVCTVCTPTYSLCLSSNRDGGRAKQQAGVIVIFL
jgi:hypothetical protein